MNDSASLVQPNAKRSGGTGDGEGDASVVVFDATISDEEYFASEGIDQSMLKQWLRSPAALGLYLRDQGSGAMSPALEFGTAMHALTLGKGLPVVEKKPRTKTDGEHTWLTPAAYATAMDMLRLGGAKEYFQSLGGTAETVMMAVDPATGLRLKAKADWLPATVDADGVYRIRDYKTTMKALDSEDSANRVIYGDLRYDIQAAFYMMVYRLASGWTGPWVSSSSSSRKPRPTPRCARPSTRMRPRTRRRSKQSGRVLPVSNRRKATARGRSS